MLKRLNRVQKMSSNDAFKNYVFNKLFSYNLYIYIYVCVCVCVCECAMKSRCQNNFLQQVYCQDIQKSVLSIYTKECTRLAFSLPRI